MQNYWRGLFRASIEGNIREFTKYTVHYIGQATKQNIWERLTGHKQLQDILSMEYPFKFGSLPTHEIAVLTFTIPPPFQIDSFGPDASDDEVLRSFMGNNVPEQRSIYLDAEKALVKAMEPRYNSQLFKNYPKSADGLHSHKLDSISYTFHDPITLLYEQGEIRGGLNYMGGDIIQARNNMHFKIVRFGS